jgi:hypothetical protein
MQNCGISYFIFDDIASLPGSAERQNVDPAILSDICQGLKNENIYFRDLLFLGVETQQCTLSLGWLINYSILTCALL